MAERLAEFPTSPSRSRPGHPWDEWLDGNPWRLTQGQDFTGSPLNFCGTAWKRARDRGLRLRTHRNGDTVVIQAYRGTA